MPRSWSWHIGTELYPSTYLSNASSVKPPPDHQVQGSPVPRKSFTIFSDRKYIFSDTFGKPCHQIRYHLVCFLHGKKKLLQILHLNRTLQASASAPVVWQEKLRKPSKYLSATTHIIIPSNHNVHEPREMTWAEEQMQQLRHCNPVHPTLTLQQDNERTGK